MVWTKIYGYFLLFLLLVFLLQKVNWIFISFICSPDGWWIISKAAFGHHQCGFSPELWRNPKNAGNLSPWCKILHLEIQTSFFIQFMLNRFWAELHLRSVLELTKGLIDSSDPPAAAQRFHRVGSSDSASADGSRRVVIRTEAAEPGETSRKSFFFLKRFARKWHACI